MSNITDVDLYVTKSLDRCEGGARFFPNASEYSNVFMSSFVSIDIKQVNIVSFS
jgi:hypothetical protein